MNWNSMNTAPRDSTPVLVLHKHHGVMEGCYEPGTTVRTQEGEEFEGAVWVLGDDILQEETEEVRHDDQVDFYDTNIVGWLPRNVLPPFTENS